MCEGSNFGTIKQTVGQSDSVCRFCGALYFKDEGRMITTGSKRELTFMLCCKEGKLRDLPTLPPAPPILSALLGFAHGHLTPSQTFSPKVVVDFQDNIRRCNAAMGFAAFTTQRSESCVADAAVPSSTGGPPVFVMHGRPYHVVSTLRPSDPARKQSYGQLYIYDSTEASQLRAHSFEGLRPDTLLSLAHILARR